MTSPYSIREVDAFDEATALELQELHTATFLDQAPRVDFEIGHWWIAYCDRKPIGFIGMTQNTARTKMGYFIRVGVLPRHRGRRLQRRLMIAMERRARRNGWTSIVSDNTNDNPASANSFIGAGYKMFWPQKRWALSNSVYWRKSL